MVFVVPIERLIYVKKTILNINSENKLNVTREKYFFYRYTYVIYDVYFSDYDF